MLYRDLAKCQILPALPLFLLYETSPNRGHWTLIDETPEGIEHFDSYGLMPDKELAFVPEPFRAASDQLHTHLLRLLLATGRPIVYNHHKFQAGGNIATCGRWCILRHMLRDLTTNQFIKAIGGGVRAFEMAPDQLAVYLTEPLFEIRGGSKAKRERRPPILT